MKITDLIDRMGFVTALKGKDKKSVLLELVKAAKVASGAKRFPYQEVRQAVLEREKMATTGIGNGIAVPHARTSAVSKLTVVVGRSREGVAFDAIDGERVHLFFLVLGPPASENYAEAIRTIMETIRKENVRKFLMNAESAKEMEEILKDSESTLQVTP